ncbi:MAG: cytochrome [Verrucomicrobiaceae bacterium]|nr:cytochrome [Verrucomicrobiaceae bacterium]
MTLPAIPAHVPPHLVGDYPLVLGAVSDENPFNRIIPDIQNGPAVMYSPNGYLGMKGAWVFNRAADLQAIYLDTEHFSVKDFAPFAKFVGENWNLVPAEIDAPMHGLYRAMVNPIFTPRRMAQFENRVRELAREYIAPLKNRNECELMNDFAFRFPIAVFLELMGLPMSNVEQFLEWENGLLHNPNVDVITASTRAVTNYLQGEIDARRNNLTDDLISYGLKAEIDGRKLTDDEMMGFCFNLFVGGMDTVSTTVSLQFRHLAEHPEHQAILRDDPSKIPMAVEELLRAYSPSTTARTCIKAVKVAGVQIMPGDKVLMATTLVNRDPEAFDAPNEVRLDRNPRHIAFGFGVHRCVGAPLARREVIIALEEFLSAIPPFRIAADAHIQTYLGGVIQPVSLPLVWD